MGFDPNIELQIPQLLIRDKKENHPKSFIYTCTSPTTSACSRHTFFWELKRNEYVCMYVCSLRGRDDGRIHYAHPSKVDVRVHGHHGLSYVTFTYFNHKGLTCSLSCSDQMILNDTRFSSSTISTYVCMYVCGHSHKREREELSYRSVPLIHPT